MGALRFKEFEELLVYNCSATLIGTKAASLFSMEMANISYIDEQIAHYNEQLADDGLVLKRMCYCEKRALIMVYSKSRLESLLADKGNRAYLIACGYGLQPKLEADLGLLEQHLLRHEGFPHEIGIFLGYPLEDVLGFVLNNGRSFKYAGFWKVYGDVEKAKGLFAKYETYYKILSNKLLQGIKLKHALAACKEVKLC